MIDITIKKSWYFLISYVWKILQQFENSWQLHTENFTNLRIQKSDEFKKENEKGLVVRLYIILIASDLENPQMKLKGPVTFTATYAIYE